MCTTLLRRAKRLRPHTLSAEANLLQSLSTNKIFNEQVQILNVLLEEPKKEHKYNDIQGYETGGRDN